MAELSARWAVEKRGRPASLDSTGSGGTFAVGRHSGFRLALIALLFAALAACARRVASVAAITRSSAGPRSLAVVYTETLPAQTELAFLAADGSERFFQSIDTEPSLGVCFWEAFWPSKDVVAAVAKRCDGRLFWISFDFRAHRFADGVLYKDFLLAKVRRRRGGFLEQAPLYRVQLWLESDAPLALSGIPEISPWGSPPAEPPGPLVASDP